MTHSPSKKTTKKELLIRLRSIKPGRSTDSLCKTLEWLPHTLRASISGLCKAGYPSIFSGTSCPWCDSLD